MGGSSFLVPDDFRAFMKRVVAYVDMPGDDKFLDAEDALHDETGYGGRIEPGTFRFSYITKDGVYKWELVLADKAVRDIADGLLIEVPGVRHEIARTKERMPTGEPLLVWGEYRDDALAIQHEDQLAAALDALHAASFDEPRMLRLWSVTDDLCVAVIDGDDCALYVIESIEGYGTSRGDASRTDVFELHDHDGKLMTVPGADCTTWDIAKRALVQFSVHGETDVELEGRIPSQLLIMGDIDRRAALAMRGSAPRELAASSLARLATPIPAEIIAVDETTVPHELGGPMRLEDLAAWARRLIEVLDDRALIEVRGNLDEISYQLGGLLQAHGSEAVDSLDTAEWLANEMSAVRGISKLFATGGDLQIALRRSRHV